MIEASGLHKSFGNINAVQDVSFMARDGEITGLLGPNGAGKTTTLRMLYTLMKPQRGEVRVDGFNATSNALEVRRRLGVLPDARGLYRRLTARENIEYYARLQGLPTAIVTTRIEQLLSMLEMNEFADRHTEGFSQGQRVKTAIARALVHDPRNVILDEPTNGLDVMATRSLREFLKTLRAEGRCVLFSTHIMQEVAALCDRIVIIAHGRVVAQGTANSLREQANEANLEDAFVKLIGEGSGSVAMKLFRTPTATVYLKELRESLRDRRVLLNALLLGPLIGPVMFLVILRMVVAHEVEQAEKLLPLPVIGAEHAPSLISALKQADIEILPPVENPEAAIRTQQRDLILRIPADYGEDWRAGKPAQVEIFYDSSRGEAQSQAQRLRSALNAYSQLQGSMRIIARGISPAVMHPIVIAERDQATPQSRGAMLFAMLPYFLVLTAFMGGMFLAIDATAGERERHSLEPLFINPVSTSSVLLGKLGAICTFSLISVMIGLTAFAIAGYLLPANMQTSVVLNAGFALRALPLMLPLVLLISIVQTLVTAYSKNFREAQTWLGLLQLIPSIPSIVLAILPFKPQLWAYAVPLVGQQLTFMRLLRGEPITWLQSGLCTVATLASVVVLFHVAKRIYASERLAISP